MENTEDKTVMHFHLKQHSPSELLKWNPGTNKAIHSFCLYLQWDQNIKKDITETEAENRGVKTQRSKETVA